MRNQYDLVAWVSELKRPYHSGGLIRERGYAVSLEGAWFYFPALEPAYAFGRAGRMSLQVGSWGIVEAVTEAKAKPRGGDTRTLYLLEGSSVRNHDPVWERELLHRFANGVRPDSSHWHNSTD